MILKYDGLYNARPLRKDASLDAKKHVGAGRPSGIAGTEFLAGGHIQREGFHECTAEMSVKPCARVYASVEGGRKHQSRIGCRGYHAGGSEGHRHYDGAFIAGKNYSI